METYRQVNYLNLRLRNASTCCLFVMNEIVLSGSEYEVVDYIELSTPQLKVVLRETNKPEVRRWDKDSHTISWDEHLSFIKSLKGNEERKYYAIFKGQDYIGTINFRSESEGVWSRGIYSIVSKQGKGETMKWEQQVMTALPRDVFKTIVAEVRIDNIRSIRYHEKMGYIETGRDDNYVYYKKELL